MGQKDRRLMVLLVWDRVVRFTESEWRVVARGWEEEEMGSH